jgi:hypothetical protein
VVVTPDLERAVDLLGSAVDARDQERVFVRTSDPARLNERLVTSGVRVLELGPERRSLEDVIEERTSARRAGEVPQ